MKLRCMYKWMFLLISLPLWAQQTPKAFRGIDKNIDALMATHQTAGLAVAVVKDNQLIYAKGFGYRDVAQQLPTDANTVFHIASMTKAFTGALLGTLVAKGQLSLDDKPAMHIPNFNFATPAMDRQITIADLLSHKSGIGNQGHSIVMFPERNKLAAIDRLKYLKPQGKINDSFLYSNMGYTLAGTIAEQLGHKSWEDQIAATFFEPLQMQHSFTTVAAMQKTKNFAKGYAVHQNKLLARPFEDYYAYTPAGAIKSSVTDLSYWMRAWLQKGKFNGKQIIPEAYVQAASSLQNLKREPYDKDAFLFGEGFGWRLSAWYGKYRLRHGGNTLGFSSIMDLYPFDGIGIVVLSNQENSLVPYAVSDIIFRKLMHLPEFQFPVSVGAPYVATTTKTPWNQDKMPTHPIADFKGSYTAKGFGTIQVETEGQSLFVNFPTYRFKLAHLNHNFFYLKGSKDFAGPFNPSFDVEFVHNWRGEIYGLKLYGQKEPILFKKQ